MVISESSIDGLTNYVQGVSLLRRFRSQKRRGRVVTSGQFLKKGLPGRVDTSGTKTTIKTGKLWKCDLP